MPETLSTIKIEAKTRAFNIQYTTMQLWVEVVIITSMIILLTTEPHAEVLAGQPAPALCTLCFLIYYFFQFMNNGTSFSNISVCFDYTNLLLLQGFYTLLKAIADSMGSFYDLIAVQAMGCPSYQTLFGTC
ncbi:unnamed protein product [Haemonchus placei]|uniref:7TM_GPCR_Srx domain-containing protein n=1 Tax=Haemonchus placei TaxID=6290 RepID=A0A0N4W4F6_HAEPC|nr:unnamed protein product [Haemonchus placei]